MLPATGNDPSLPAFFHNQLSLWPSRSSSMACGSSHAVSSAVGGVGHQPMRGNKGLPRDTAQIDRGRCLSPTHGRGCGGPRAPKFRMQENPANPLRGSAGGPLAAGSRVAGAAGAAAAWACHVVSGLGLGEPYHPKQYSGFRSCLARLFVQAVCLIRENTISTHRAFACFYNAVSVGRVCNILLVNAG